MLLSTLPSFIFFTLPEVLSPTCSLLLKLTTSISVPFVPTQKLRHVTAHLRHLDFLRVGAILEASWRNEDVGYERFKKKKGAGEDTQLERPQAAQDPPERFVD